MTSDDYDRARRLLIRRDPVLGAAIKRIGPCGMAARQRADHLTASWGPRQPATVDESGCQRSSDASRPVSCRRTDQRHRDRFALADERAQIRRVERSEGGLPPRSLWTHADGRLQLQELDGLPMTSVVERLTAVKDSGGWTAEMFLMFRLHRPTCCRLPIWASSRRCRNSTDCGAAEDGTDSCDRRAWRPYRSVASWYLWQTLHAQTPPDRKPRRVAK